MRSRARPADNQTVRNVFVIGPDKKIKLILIYPMSTGRNFDEVLRVIDSLQLTARHQVSTPVNWNPGEDVIIVGFGLRRQGPRAVRRVGSPAPLHPDRSPAAVTPVGGAAKGPPIETRRATVEDVDTMLLHVREGFETYVRFAPAGWQPPEDRGARERTVERLADPGTWALIALSAGEPVGHISFVAASERPPAAGHWRGRPLVAGLAHLWQLFVRPPWWGTGVAATLHDTAVGEMARQRFNEARLYTPRRPRARPPLL